MHSRNPKLPPSKRERVPGLEQQNARSGEEALEVERQVHETDSDEFGDFTYDEKAFQPVIFPDIPARPGYRQRWVLVGMQREYALNEEKAYSQGWRPRTLDLPPRHDFLSPEQTSSEGVYRVRNHVLMEKSEVLGKKRDAYYAEKNRRQMEGVERNLDRVQGSGKPIHRQFDRKVETHAGNHPRVRNN